MNKLYGSYEIAKYLGMKDKYIHISVLLRFLEAPQIISTQPNSKGVKMYCITEYQADCLRKMIDEMRNCLMGGDEK